MREIKIFAITMVSALWLGASATASEPARTTSTNKQPPQVVQSSPKRLPTDVQALVQKFDGARDSYLAEQKALLQKLKGSSEEQRERIRAQLQAKRDEFHQQASALREEIKDRMAELKNQLHAHKKPIDKAGGKGRPGTH